MFKNANYKLQTVQKYENKVNLKQSYTAFKRMYFTHSTLQMDRFRMGDKYSDRYSDR